MSFLYRIDVNNNVMPLERTPIKDYLEKDIENLIERNPSIIGGENILIIGRQVTTDTGKILDILGVDIYGRCIVIELKKDYAPRDVIAQIMDYASWVNGISERQLEDIAKNYFVKKSLPFKTLHEAYVSCFNMDDAITFGTDVVLIVMAQEFPPEVLRTATFLSERGTAVKCVSFELFLLQDEKFLIIKELAGFFEEGRINEKSKALPKKTTENNNARKYFDNLKIYLDQDCEDVFYKNQHPVQRQLSVYQDRDGKGTQLSIGWEYNQGILVFSIAYIVSERSITVQIYSKKRTKLSERIEDQQIKSLISRLELSVENDNNGPWIFFEITDINELNDNVYDVIVKTVALKFKPLLNELLK